jgi:hypothetical protein
MAETLPMRHREQDSAPLQIRLGSFWDDEARFALWHDVLDMWISRNTSKERRYRKEYTLLR